MIPVSVYFLKSRFRDGNRGSANRKAGNGECSGYGSATRIDYVTVIVAFVESFADIEFGSKIATTRTTAQSDQQSSETLRELYQTALYCLVA